MGGGSAPTRNIYNETYGELLAKQQLAPDIYATEAQYRPKYSALDLENLHNILQGTPGGERTIYVEGTKRVPVYATERGTGRRRIVDYREIPTTTAKTIKTEATPGLIETYRNADPANAKLWDDLTQQASSGFGVDPDAGIDPELLRIAQQSVRSRQLGTLGSNGPAGNYGEALGVSEFAQGLRTQNRAFATQMAGANDARANNLLNRAQGISQSAAPRLFGSTVNANDVFSSNQNAKAAANAADAAQTNSMISAGAGIAAAALMAFA